ncbi:MAG TPA: S1-like domain-containing RNA-binding protein [Bacteroidia bacterium]|nr:S1-like domain-containing RNA-binding protein [Bacteroidia bacterium]HRH08401.1 S1-like domain-containing RNA-binding protein [Bacteroidia bacterium]HRH63040.1 S1-like domain-containing RNA-binding protein [Bacteroidia bacterium]
MLELGKFNTLKIARKVDFGVFLSSGTDEVLLPKKYLEPDMEIGSEVEVFIYKDSEDRSIATTQKPYAQVGEFAYLKVKEVNSFGAFMDWGLEKDLLVPFREQDKKLEAGKSYVVYVYVDKLTKRIAASAKINRYAKNEGVQLSENEEVDLLLFKQTDLGYGAIINNLHQGLIYKNEVFTNLAVGDKVKGWIKTLREDGRIDLRLQKVGFELSDDAQDIILKKLAEKNGFLALHDASEPQLINKELGMSKKTFKKAIGGLFKSKRISIEENGIKLL